MEIKTPIISVASPGNIPRRLQRGSFLAFFLAAIVAMAGCAPKIPDTNYAQRYPAYPAEPRIAYQKSYYGGGDEEFEGLLEKIIGSAQSDLMAKPFQAVWRKDTLYVTMQNENELAVIDTVNKTYTSIKNFDDEVFQSVRGLAVSSAGDIYVTDTKAARVYVADEHFKLKKIIGDDKKSLIPFGIALDEKRDRLYIIDSLHRSIKAFTMAGEFLFEFGKNPDDNAQEKDAQKLPYNYYAIGVDKRNGRIVASDSDNFAIRVFDDKGGLIMQFGEASDGPLGFGLLRGVAVNSEGHIYATDVFSHTISMFNDEGKSLMIFGDYGTGPGQFSIPIEISFDESDRLFVADSLNGRVQVFQYLSDQWKKDHPEEYAKYLAPPPAKKEVLKQKNRGIPLKH